MTIEIRKPELEALIRERLKGGPFQDIEDVLMQALESAPLPAENLVGQLNNTSSSTGAELVAAMQASPFREISLEPDRGRMPVRDLLF